MEAKLPSLLPLFVCVCACVLHNAFMCSSHVDILHAALHVPSYNTHHAEKRSPSESQLADQGMCWPVYIYQQYSLLRRDSTDECIGRDD